MDESSPSDAALVELLSLTVTVNRLGATFYRNHLGQAHRTLGPAVIYPNGSVCWYHLGQRHRTDGPAVEGVNGRNHWFIHGHELTEEEFNERIKSV